MTESSQPGTQSGADPGLEVERLKLELAQLRTQQTTVITPPPPVADNRRGASGWGRTLSSFVLILIAVILTPLAISTTFAVSQVSDTERYLATVEPLASDPAVQAAVTDRLTKEIFYYIDLDEVSKTAVGAIGDTADLDKEQEALLLGLSGPLKSGLESFTRDQIQKIIQSDAFATAWAEANRVAHTQIVKLLSGDASGSLSVADGKIAVNLGTVLQEAKSEMVSAGFDLADKIPAVDAEFVIFESANLAALQTWYGIFTTIGYWLPIVGMVLLAIGIFVANNRRFAIGAYGAGAFVALLLLSVALGVARSKYLLALPPEANRDAAISVFDTVTFFLYEGIRAAAVAALIIFAAAVLTGPARAAVKLRSAAKTVATRVGDGLESLGVPMYQIQQKFADMATPARIGATVIAVVVVVAPQYTTPALVWWTTAGLLVALFVIQVFASPRAEPAAGSEADPEPAAGSETNPEPAGEQTAVIAEPSEPAQTGDSPTPENS